MSWLTFENLIQNIRLLLLNSYFSSQFLRHITLKIIKLCQIINKHGLSSNNQCLLTFCGSNSFRANALNLSFLMSVTDLKYFAKEQNPVVKTHFSVTLANSITFDRSHLNFKLFPLKSIPKWKEMNSLPEWQVTYQSPRRYNYIFTPHRRHLGLSNGIFLIL